MELKDNITFLQSMAETLEKEVAVEDAAVKEYLTTGRERMAKLEKKRERLYHIQNAINNLTALANEVEEHAPVTDDPWA